MLAAAVGLLALLTGPPGFDSIDGSEFTVAAERMAVAHPPGYPLLLFMLRILPGSGYASCLAFSAICASVAALAASSWARASGRSEAASLAASAILVCSPPVFSQMNCVEVHPLAVVLTLLAVSASGGLARPYCFSLAVFGGHPAALLTAPLALARPVRLTTLSALLAALPATLALYTPIVAASSSPMHYGRPAAPEGLAAYLTLYRSRLTLPDPAFPSELLSGFGPVTACVMAFFLAFSGRPRRSEAAALAVSVAALACYRVPDKESLLWVLPVILLPALARGIDRLAGRGALAGGAAALLVSASAASGILRSDRTRDVAACLGSRDMLRGAPFEAVFCTIGHDAFYAAYNTDLDDFRPDIIPADMYGIYFDLRLASPLPPAIGDRPVVATRGWTEPFLHLDGLLFTSGERARPGWDAMEVFSAGFSSPDVFSRDYLAELIARRAVQSPPAERDSLSALALATAGSDLARNRLEAILELDR